MRGTGRTLSPFPPRGHSSPGLPFWPGPRRRTLRPNRSQPTRPGPTTPPWQFPGWPRTSRTALPCRSRCRPARRCGSAASSPCSAPASSATRRARRRCSTSRSPSAGWRSARPCRATSSPTAISARSPGRRRRELRAWLAHGPTCADAPAVHALLLNRLPRGAARPAGARHASRWRPTCPPPRPPPRCPRRPKPSARCPTATPRSTAPSRRRRAGRQAGSGGTPAGAARAACPPAYAALLRGEAGADPVHPQPRRGRLRAGLRGRPPLPAPRLQRRRAGRPRSPGWPPGGWAGPSWRAARSRRAGGPSSPPRRCAPPPPSGPPAPTCGWPTRRATCPGCGAPPRERRTFYGMLARRTLGLDIGFGPAGQDARDTLGAGRHRGRRRHAAGHARLRPAAGRPGRTAPKPNCASSGRRCRSEPALGRAVMLVAVKAGLIELAAQLADLVQTADGRPREQLRFPLPRLRPAGGFRLDPALVYGIARTESNFDADMVSSAGAVGLMQIMPDTASFITGRPADAVARGDLRDPSLNLDLGQRYVDYLGPARRRSAATCLRLLASYNCRPRQLRALARHGSRRRRPAAVHRGDSRWRRHGPSCRACWPTRGSTRPACTCPRRASTNSPPAAGRAIIRSNRQQPPARLH